MDAGGGGHDEGRGRRVDRVVRVYLCIGLPFLSTTREETKRKTDIMTKKKKRDSRTKQALLQSLSLSSFIPRGSDMHTSGGPYPHDDTLLAHTCTAFFPVQYYPLSLSYMHLLWQFVICTHTHTHAPGLSRHHPGSPSPFVRACRRRDDSRLSRRRRDAQPSTRAPPVPPIDSSTSSHSISPSESNPILARSFSASRSC